MSALAEKALVGLLTDADSVRYLARVGVPPEIVVTPPLRGVVEWALAYYEASRKAPTRAVLEERFTAILSDYEVDLSKTVHESVEWARNELLADHLRGQLSRFSRRMLDEVAAVPAGDRLEAYESLLVEMSSVATALRSTETHTDMRTRGAAILSRYEHAKEYAGTLRGLTMGLDLVDDYTGGIWPTELAMVMAYAKGGKSQVLNNGAYRHWEAGGSPLLASMENSREMTENRIACYALGLDSTELDRGRLSEADEARMREWVNDVLAVADNPLHIITPEKSSQTTPEYLVREAVELGADALYLDQLTFMSPAERKSRMQSWEKMEVVLHSLKFLLRKHDLSALLAHQANRAGNRETMKTGRAEMDHAANGSEAERTVDWQFALVGTPDQVADQERTLQTTATRRGGALLSFRLAWRLDIGSIQAVSASAA